jgi:type IV fimbrial biogenesis protein FimT
MKILFSHQLHPGKKIQRAKGFTLVEMIVTVTIAAILASIAIPSFTKMIERNRISTGTNEFLSALILARSEAVKRSSPVVVCASTNSSTCSGTTDFASGWIIYPDCDGDGALGTTNTCDMDGNGVNETSETAAIIKVHDALPQLSIVSSTANTSSISYAASGRSTSMTIVIGKDTNTPSRQIDISLTGRVKSCKSGTTGGC